MSFTTETFNLLNECLDKIYHLGVKGVLANETLIDHFSPLDFWTGGHRGE